MSKERFRIVIPHTETVVDEGPRSMDTRHGSTNIWQGNSYPEQDLLNHICYNLPPRLETVDATGFKDRLSNVETVTLERGDRLEVQST
jgi:hypothetical protein